jgi:hypothetical protein
MSDKRRSQHDELRAIEEEIGNPILRESIASPFWRWTKTTTTAKTTKTLTTRWQKLRRPP